MAHRYTSSPPGDGSKSRILVLKMARDGQEITATINKEKSSMLAKTFFPPRPLEGNQLQFVYPRPLSDPDPRSREQIKRQLAKLKPYKAPGPDGIPNIMLTKCSNIITVTVTTTVRLT